MTYFRKQCNYAMVMTRAFLKVWELDRGIVMPGVKANLLGQRKECRGTRPGSKIHFCLSYFASLRCFEAFFGMRYPLTHARFVRLGQTGRRDVPSSLADAWRIRLARARRTRAREGAGTPVVAETARERSGRPGEGLGLAASAVARIGPSRRDQPRRSRRSRSSPRRQAS